MKALVDEIFKHHLALVDRVGSVLTPKIVQVAEVLIQAIKSDRTVFWCGNGGSAADSQHLAAELVGRFQHDRPALASVALTTDTSILTSVGNDYGYEYIFSRQVDGLTRPGDVLVCISTSGNSPNVVAAAKSAKARSVATVALCGSDGGALAPLCDQVLVVPDQDTARIQEMHMLIGHILCDLVERSVIADR